jgi:Uma2 family endonuclease
VSEPALRPATVEDLYRTEGKAELVGGRLKIMEPTGFAPGRASWNITFALREYERQTRSGYAVPENVSFLVDLPNRQSFCPDGAYFLGRDSGLKFPEGAPVLAIEVRSEGDYGLRAEREMAAKRAEYFAAGTLVVWDVDLVGADTVRVFRASDPQRPTVYRRGQVAEAEPALPGWTMRVDDVFD